MIVGDIVTSNARLFPDKLGIVTGRLDSPGVKMAAWTE